MILKLYGSIFISVKIGLILLKVKMQMPSAICTALSVIAFDDYFNLGYSMFLAFPESQMLVMAAQMYNWRYEMPASQGMSPLFVDVFS